MWASECMSIWERVLGGVREWTCVCWYWMGVCVCYILHWFYYVCLELARWILEREWGKWESERVREWASVLGWDIKPVCMGNSVLDVCFYVILRRNWIKRREYRFKLGGRWLIYWFVALWVHEYGFCAHWDRIRDQRHWR